MAILRHMADAESAHPLADCAPPAAAARRRPGSRRRSAAGCRRAPPAVPTGRCRRRRRRRGFRLRADANETSSTRATPRSSRTIEAARLERDLARMRRALVDLEDHLAADHRVGELGGEVSAVSKVATISPRRITETRSVSAHDLAQLVGDEDDRLVLRPSAPAASRTADRPRPASARRSARRAPGFRRRAPAPSGFRRAAAGRPTIRRRSRRDRPRARIRLPSSRELLADRAAPSASSGPPSAPSMTFSSTLSGGTSMKC